MNEKIVELEELIKALASEKKLKLIIHLYSCTCGKCNVNFLVQQQMATQSNISKHLMALRKSGIVSFSQINRQRHYEISSYVRENYKILLEAIMILKNDKSIYCECAL